MEKLMAEIFLGVYCNTPIIMLIQHILGIS